MTPIPTLAEIEAVITNTDTDFLNDSDILLLRLAACLRDGAAIISRGDREAALIGSAARLNPMALVEENEKSLRSIMGARRLLQLEQP